VIKKLRLEYPLKVVCRVLAVSLSGFYGWLHRKKSAKYLHEARLVVEIKAIHVQSRETYGAKRIQAELKSKFIFVGLSKIRRLRNLHQIKCKQYRAFKITTNSKHSLPFADNLLQQNFNVTTPNKVWVSDITYIRTLEGWLYLAGIKDLCTKEIVGYSLSERMSKDLVLTALNNAVYQHRPAAGLILHSDRGSQYCSKKYVNRVKQYQMLMSMSRKGNCYDNAPIESFWGLLKNELIYHKQYKTRAEASKDIIQYIEIFYNRQRKQAKLGYHAPAVYAQKIYAAGLKQQNLIAA